MTSVRRTRRRTSRPRAVVLCVLALALGLVAGHLLPDEDSAQARGSGTPSARPKAPPPAYATTPPTEADLVSVAGFRKAGLDVTVYPQHGNTSPSSPVTDCTGARTVGARTLADITGHDPQVLGTWDEAVTTNTADELLAMTDSPAAAERATLRLLAANSTCQHQPVGKDVYGPIRRERLATGVWTAWLGSHPGQQNRTGEAPAGADACGGVVIVRNGRRFAVLEVFMCADDGQLRTLAAAAADRLG